MDTIRAYREILKENIEYDILRKNLGYDCDLLDEILDILVDTVCSTRKMIRIGGEDYPKEVVKSRLLKLDSGHIEYVISSLHENTTKGAEHPRLPADLPLQCAYYHQQLLHRTCQSRYVRQRVTVFFILKQGWRAGLIRPALGYQSVNERHCVKNAHGARSFHS